MAAAATFSFFFPWALALVDAFPPVTPLISDVGRRSACDDAVEAEGTMAVDVEATDGLCGRSCRQASVCHAAVQSSGEPWLMAYLEPFGDCSSIGSIGTLSVWAEGGV